MKIDYSLAFQFELMRLLRDHFAQIPSPHEVELSANGDEDGRVCLHLNVGDHYWIFNMEGYPEKVCFYHNHKKDGHRVTDMDLTDPCPDAPEATAARVLERLVAQLPA